MKLRDKIIFFYNDIFKFIEDLRDLKVINLKASGVILTILSETYHKNFGSSGLNKSYKKIDAPNGIKQKVNELNEAFEIGIGNKPTDEEIEKIINELDSELDLELDKYED